jgi:hypothetical protein
MGWVCVIRTSGPPSDTAQGPYSQHSHTLCLSRTPPPHTPSCTPRAHPRSPAQRNSFSLHCHSYLVQSLDMYSTLAHPRPAEECTAEGRAVSWARLLVCTAARGHGCSWACLLDTVASRAPLLGGLYRDGHRCLVDCTAMDTAAATGARLSLVSSDVAAPSPANLPPPCSPWSPSIAGAGARVWPRRPALIPPPTADGHHPRLADLPLVIPSRPIQKAASLIQNTPTPSFSSCQSKA